MIQTPQHSSTGQPESGLLFVSLVSSQHVLLNLEFETAVWLCWVSFSSRVWHIIVFFGGVSSPGDSMQPP